MIDVAMHWACAHPIGFVSLLCGLAALIGASFGIVPRVIEHTHDIHPRC